MNYQVLLVEDSEEVYKLVEQAIASPVLELTWCQTTQGAEDLFTDRSFDLIIIDIELPDGSGIELCSKMLADDPLLPVFILSDNDNVSEKVLGFSAGADGYITKPFNALALKARVEAKLKKQDIINATQEMLEWKEIEINMASQEVQVLNNSDEKESIELTALEFKILTYLAQRVDEVVERDLMLDEIWGKDVHVYSRSVDTHVSKLRKKLGDQADLIESIHGVGYKFSATPL